MVPCREHLTLHACTAHVIASDLQLIYPVIPNPLSLLIVHTYLLCSTIDNITSCLHGSICLHLNLESAVNSL
jgi:hypothetical protein